MKIDEQWIRKAAGWKALKEGREIFARGVVTKATQNEGLIVGEIAGDGKPLRVTVRIHSDVDVDTVCPRMACRRTGEICQHAVAVMLATLPGVSVPAAKKTERVEVERVPENVPKLRVCLPPNFPKGLPEGGGLSVKLEASDSERALSSGDVQMARWLEQHAGGKVPPMFGIKGAQALVFLKALDGHGELQAGERQVFVGSNGVRVPMHVAMEDERVELRLCPSIAVHGTSWYAAGDLWLWDAEQSVLVVIDVSAVLNERQWLRVASGQPVYVPLKQFIQQMSDWQSFALWDDNSVLSEIPMQVGEPEFHLKIEGSTEKLRASLQAHYSPEVSLVLGLFGAESAAFPMEDVRRPGHWIERNRDAEDAAAGVLMRYGFQLAGTQGEWELVGDDGVIDFLTEALPELEEKWKVETGGRLRSIKGNLVRVRPQINVQGSGEDWLAFDYGFQTDGGREIPREVIQKMLASGKRSGTTKNGKQVVISQFDAEMMEAVLRDTDPRQEGGKFYVPKNQGAYLRRIREYYKAPAISECTLDPTLLQALPVEISAALRDYQRAGIAWLYERCEQESAALLADDMGLGKTVQTLALLSLRQSLGGPSLVVCPTSLLGNWADEAAKWAPQLRVQVMHGEQRQEHFDTLGTQDLVITSYALVARDLEQFQKLSLNTLVLDEASVIRNPDTQAAKALRKLESRARVALSGTPVENAVRDLWSLYAFLLPGYLGTREDFKNRYEQALSGVRPDENVLRRLRLRVEPFMLRRTKAQVAKDLPKKLEQILWCDPSKLQKEAYEEILRQGVSQVDALEGGRARMQMLTVLLRLRQASCDLRLLGDTTLAKRELAELSAKLEMLVELLHEAKRGGHRVLVFSQFTKMLGLIREVLEQEGISMAYLDGATRDRSGEVKKFQSPQGPDVFLISLKAGGYGLNLTAADTVVHFDPWWNPAVEAQATDRAYRIGQTKPVTVYKLIARGTVEEKILKLQERKKGLIGAAISDEAEPMLTGLSENEMRSLLE